MARFFADFVPKKAYYGPRNELVRMDGDNDLAERSFGEDDPLEAQGRRFRNGDAELRERLFDEQEAHEDEIFLQFQQQVADVRDWDDAMIGTSEDSGLVTVSDAMISEDEIDSDEVAVLEAENAAYEQPYNFRVVYPREPSEGSSIVFQNATSSSEATTTSSEDSVAAVDSSDVNTSSDDGIIFQDSAATTSGTSQGNTTVGSDEFAFHRVQHVLPNTSVSAGEETSSELDTAFIADEEDSDDETDGDRTIVDEATPTKSSANGGANPTRYVAVTTSDKTTSDESVEIVPNLTLVDAEGASNTWHSFVVSDNPAATPEAGGARVVTFTERPRRQGLTSGMRRRMERADKEPATTSPETQYPASGFARKSGRSFRKRRLNLDGAHPGKAKFCRYADGEDFTLSRRRLPLPFCCLSRRPCSSITVDHKLENGLRQRMAQVKIYFLTRRHNLDLLKRDLEAGNFGMQLTLENGTELYVNGLESQELDENTEEIF